MKIIALVAATLFAATSIAVTPAAADSHVRVVKRSHTHYESNRRWHRGPSRWKWRTSCHTQWRNGHRERVCRRIRYR